MKTATPKPCFLDEDIPIYNNDGTLKTGTYQKTDENGNVTGEYMTFYRNVRTQAAIAVVSSDLEHKGEVIAVGGGWAKRRVDRGTNRAMLPHQTGSSMKPIAAYCLGIDEGWINFSSPAGGRTAVFQGEQKDAGRRPCAGARPAA